MKNDKFDKNGNLVIGPHNKLQARIFMSWCEMMDDHEKNGVEICPEWHDFENFYRWALLTHPEAPKPTPRQS